MNSSLRRHIDNLIATQTVNSDLRQSLVKETEEAICPSFVAACATLPILADRTLLRSVARVSLADYLNVLDEVLLVSETIETKLIRTGGKAMRNRYRVGSSQLRNELIHQDSRLLLKNVQAIRTELQRRGRGPFTANLTGEIEQIRHSLRLALKHTAALEEDDAWQSPSHQSSVGPLERGVVQDDSFEPYVHDYRRWSIGSHVRNWEKRYCSAAIDMPTALRRKAVSVLTSSGMGAFRIALDWSFKLLRNNYEGLMVGDSYFEIERLLTSQYQFRRIAVEQLQQLRAGRNYIIILEPITNTIQRNRIDLGNVLRTMASREKGSAVVIVDRSILGSLYQPFNERVFPGSRKGVHLICVESLLKNFQYGLELGQGGMLTTVAQSKDPETIYSDLARIRSLNGLLPADIHFSSYLPIHRELVDHRLYRQSRNAGIYAETLRSEGYALQQWNVSYPELRTGAAELPRGPLVSCFKGAVVKEDYYDRTVRHCVSQFRSAGLNINVGVGFGFNTTRLSACLHGFGDINGRFYLRVAAGPETLITTLQMAANLRKSLARMK